MKKNLPYGMWTGKIDPELVAQRSRINTLKWDHDTMVFSVSKGGKSYLYRKAPHQPAVQINGDLPVYGGVGYGGGDFGTRDGKTLFSAGKFGLQLHTEGKNNSRKLTRDTLGYASPVIHPNGKYAAYVATDGVYDQIALLKIDEYAWPERWISGADFYMQPEWSPDGKYFAWAQWDHPNMPWSGSSVWVGRVDEKTLRLSDAVQVAGGTEKPACQPHFSPDGRCLAYIETQEDWDDLVLYDLSSGEKTTLVHGEGFCLTDPAFSQGICSFAWFRDSRRIAYTRVRGTFNEIHVLDILAGSDEKVSQDRFTVFDQICVSDHDVIGAAAAGPLDFGKVIAISEEGCETVWQSCDLILDDSFISVPREISWKAENGDTVFGLYYPPCNPDCAWHGAPPAIVHVHGGPTGQADQSFSAETAYFTSLGYAYVRVNYRGSSGFGRKYIERLNGHWGEYDTEDAVTCVRWLAEQGLADEKRVLITGGSSGGYVVLNALTQYPDVFTAGASLYGVSNLYSLVIDTHKLEQHYTDSLIGVLPEADEKFRALSPMLHMDRVRVPLAIFQGDADRVVPPDQSKGLLSQLKAPHIFRLYEGEGHGFHQPEHIRDYLETLHKFMQDYL